MVLGMARRLINVRGMLMHNLLLEKHKKANLEVCIHVNKNDMMLGKISNHQYTDKE